ncbi:MAG: hypothetical protein PHR38_00955 [Bacteroidales bacterium]|nr:hypothetical protein [Bacteroidales bacterium]
MVIIYNTLEDGYDFNIKDRWGKGYHFKILTFEVPSGLESEAIEVVNEKDREPYHFLVLNPYDTDIEHCERLLKEKIKDGIDKRYLRKRNGRLEICKSEMLCGRIEWNDDFSTMSFDTYFVVDGKKITMEDFVALLQPYTGFQFQLSIKDPSD